VDVRTVSTTTSYLLASPVGERQKRRCRLPTTSTSSPGEQRMIARRGRAAVLEQSMLSTATRPAGTRRTVSLKAHRSSPLGNVRTTTGAANRPRSRT
jgi:hypothetical protein